MAGVTGWGKGSWDGKAWLYAHVVLGSGLRTISPVFGGDGFQNAAHRFPAQTLLGRLNLTLISTESGTEPWNMHFTENSKKKFFLMPLKI